jgi:hypothetical protein
MGSSPDCYEMSIFLNSPWPIICIGIFVEAVLGLILLRTGRGVLLLAMGGVLLVVLGGVALACFVVTDEKLIEASLDGCTAAMEKGDLKGVLSHVSPSAEHTRSEAARAFQYAEFIQIKIHGLDITVNKLTSPRTATAKFSALVTGRDRKGEFGTHTQPIKEFQVDFRLEGDRWLIAGHKLKDAPGGF